MDSWVATTSTEVFQLPSYVGCSFFGEKASGEETSQDPEFHDYIFICSLQGMLIPLIVEQRRASTT